MIIADTLTLALFNLNILREDDFEEVPREPEPEAEDGDQADVTRDPYGLIHNLDSEDQFDLPPQRLDDNPHEVLSEGATGLPAIRLKPKAFARVLENFERKMTTEFHYLPEDRKITLNEALVAQAGQYRKLIEGSIQEYKPLQLR